MGVSVSFLGAGGGEHGEACCGYNSRLTCDKKEMLYIYLIFPPFVKHIPFLV